MTKKHAQQLYEMYYGKLSEQKTARISTKQKYYYMDAILQPYMGKKMFGDWVLDDDYMSGSVYFKSKKYDPYLIYMTPYFEDVNGIPVSIQDDFGNSVYDKIIRFKPTYDSHKDVNQFVKIARDAAAKLEKQLKPKL